MLFATVWQIHASQVDFQPGGVLMAAGAEFDGWATIDLATGRPTPAGSEKRQWVQFGLQLLEVVYQSKNETLAVGQMSGARNSLVAFDGKGVPIKSGVGVGVWAGRLVGNPEVGPFAFNFTFGGPHNDYQNGSEVVLPNFKTVPGDFYTCLDAGKLGMLVECLSPVQHNPNFNAHDGFLRCLDPLTGRLRWKVKASGPARYWGKNIVVWDEAGGMKLYDARTGRLSHLKLSLPKSDLLLDIVGGDFLVEQKSSDGLEVARLHVEEER